MPENIVISGVVVFALLSGIVFGWYAKGLVIELTHECMPHGARICRKHHPGPIND